MKITLKNVQKFQEGGAMPPAQTPAQAPAPEAQDPLMEIAQMAMQAVEQQNCEMAMQVCAAFVQMLQQAQGGPAEAPQGEPIYRKGGILSRRLVK